MQETFNPLYLAILEGKPDMVAETAADRYLPQRPEKITEHLIQLLWRNGLYKKTGIQTTNGLPLEVIKPGRANYSAGPDFKNAEVIIGGKRVAGDVEIHIEASGWYEHKHHLSSHYNKTILHVFLNRKEETHPAATKRGNVIPELELGHYLRHSVEQLKVEIEEAELPTSGRAENPPCRNILLAAGAGNAKSLLDVVGEGRMLIKSNRLMERIKESSREQVLYEIIFEALGHSRFKRQFKRLAQLVTREKLEEAVKQNPSLPKSVTAQAILFKVSGLDETAQKTMADSNLKELLGKFERANYCGFEKAFFRMNDWQLRACRPANYPHRRMAAFAKIAFELCDVESYRQIISESAIDAPGKKNREIAKKLISLFTDISDPFWDLHYNFNRSTRITKRLIGRDRAVSLIVDCLIPFFLAISRVEGDSPLERRLLGLFHSLPKPSSNAVIDFMVRNMFGKKSVRLVKSVRHQQALIQLYNDFCHKAPAGCSECAFLDYIKITAPDLGVSSAYLDAYYT